MLQFIYFINSEKTETHIQISVSLMYLKKLVISKVCLCVCVCAHAKCLAIRVGFSEF